MGGAAVGATATAITGKIIRDAKAKKATVTPVIPAEQLEPTNWDEHEQAIVDACKDLDFPNSPDATITQF